jgi:hypothetical protein
LIVGDADYKKVKPALSMQLFNCGRLKKYSLRFMVIEKINEYNLNQNSDKGESSDFSLITLSM